jgi:transcriptional regulator with XRE-family HTH domain
MDVCQQCEKPYLVRESSFERPYEYVESGLQWVRLVGIQVYSCAACDVESADIPQLDFLHNMLAKEIVLRPIAMGGREFRFLRKEMGKKPKEMAEQFGVDPKTITNWEASEKLGRQTDLTMRMLAALDLWKGEELADVIDAISSLVSYNWGSDPSEPSNVSADISRLAGENIAFGVGGCQTWQMGY